MYELKFILSTEAKAFKNKQKQNKCKINKCTTTITTTKHEK